ncbi:hypothetical protein HNP46_004160 [Pseudomonas nitritireducens]|uniref:Uncharacterized protein n=1 Tax=Pseudomonas nitroreducens TaxID=46680 RepID=A0A7W7P378_PSENT|nr:hypothetical protein [Pseudomonas nitritireducens]MBB4865280.1 hypothetical protein [Pseudomonas nitritireducens]
MKRSPPLLLALLLTAPALAPAQAAEWKLAKDADGVRVYLSEVPGSRYKVSA